MNLVQLAQRRVRSVGPTRHLVVAGLVVPMRGNCSLDGLNGHLSGNSLRNTMF